MFMIGWPRSIMGIYVTLFSEIRSTCRKLREEMEHKHKPGAATSIPIAPNSYRSGLSLLMMPIILVSAYHHVHVPFISNPTSGVPPSSNHLYIEPCKPSFLLHQCVVHYSSVLIGQLMATGPSATVTSTKNRSLAPLWSWHLHFFG